MNTPGAYNGPPEREIYTIGHGDIVKFAVDSVHPLKSELETLDDPTDDPDAAVEWIAGMSMRLIALRSRDTSGTVRDLVEVTSSGSITYPHGRSGLAFTSRVTLPEIERGWIRRYEPVRSNHVYALPDGFFDASPRIRRDFWLTVLAGKFGLDASQLHTGTTFYAYVTKTPKQLGGVFTDVRKIYKGDDRWHDRTPLTVDAMDIRLIEHVRADLMETFRNHRGDRLSDTLESSDMHARPTAQASAALPRNGSSRPNAIVGF